LAQNSDVSVITKIKVILVIKVRVVCMFILFGDGIVDRR